MNVKKEDIEYTLDKNEIESEKRTKSFKTSKI